MDSYPMRGIAQWPSRYFRPSNSAAAEPLANFSRWGSNCMRRPTRAALEEELLLRRGAGLRVFNDGVLRVGELLVVIKKVFAPEARDGRGVSVHPQAPGGDVDVVHAVVSDVAAAEIVPPAPHAGQQVGAVGNGGRRPQPGVEIEMRRRVRRLHLADRSPELAVPGLGHED